MSPARLLSPDCSGRGLCSAAPPEHIPPHSTEPHRGARLVGMDACFSFSRQCNLSQKQFLPPHGVVCQPRQSNHSMGQNSCCAFDCPSSERLQGHFLGTFFPLFSLSPSFLVSVGRLGEQPVTLSWTLPDVAATSGYKPSLGKAVLGEYHHPSSIFCTGNNDCCKPGSCRVSLQTSSGGDAVICSRLGSAWDGKSQRELAGK